MDSLYQETWDLLSKLAPGENRLRQAFAHAYAKQQANDIAPMQELLKLLQAIDDGGLQKFAISGCCGHWDGKSNHCECGESLVQWMWKVWANIWVTYAMNKGA